jgi:hypothetical protein
MAKAILKNTARGARGVRNKAGDLIMVEPGQTVSIDDIDDAELKDATGDFGSFEKGKASDVPDEEPSTALGEPGPGDPPVPSDPPENEVEQPAARGRR